MKSPEFLTSKGIELEKSLELFGDIDTYNETISDFTSGITAKSERLKKYIEAKDMSNYAIYVHALKSDAKYFGFKKLADFAYEHEQKSKAGDIYYVNENFQHLLELVEESTEIVNEYLTGEDEEINVVEEPVMIPVVETKPVEAKTESIYTTKTILVVDDSNIIRNFVKRIYEDKYQIGTAKDGKEAIDIIEANQSNENILAILLDLNMPRVDGFKVLEYMDENSLFSQMPVSIISGDSTKSTIDKAFNYPIVDMLGKPFNDADIKRVIEKTLMYKELI